MLVSWNWLQEYVPLRMPVTELETRLMMAGLNHEGTDRIGDDVVIDLEVTSNRPDCLGHIGVAREISVLWDEPLSIPQPRPVTGTSCVEDLASLQLACPELCRGYRARVLCGVAVGPSPPWLVDRLRAVGMPTVNNVVDVTNFVLMECGQPLHAFDLARLAGRSIRVRRARRGEQFLAIDHRTYELEDGMCVIADAERPVALGGVMGGANTEVSAATTDLLIETAWFDPLSIRTTARKLNLHSPSSYRFERGVDPEGLDWAGSRCAELILETAGGELAAGVLGAGIPPEPRQPIVLRRSQLPRVLGIEIDFAAARRILTALGNTLVQADDHQLAVIPPSWRGDLTREIDLVEEVARIHGYDKIAEDVGVPMVPSNRRDKDRVLNRLRHAATAAGFNEAITISTVAASWDAVSTPWSELPSLSCRPAVLRGSDRLRKTIVPSLLAARRANEALANGSIELFEIANVYLPQPGAAPCEVEMLALCSGRGFLAVKGVVEGLFAAMGSLAQLEVDTTGGQLLNAQRSCGLRLDGVPIGYLGDVSAEGLQRFELRHPATVAEVRLSAFLQAARLVAQAAPLSPYPAVSRDRNVVFDESVRWADVASVVRDCAGPHLERLAYQETYRDERRLGKGRKSLLFALTLRSHNGTLTGEEADAICARIDACLRDRLGGKLRS